MTLLAVPVFGESIEQIRQDIARATELGADLVELRLDRMLAISDDEIRSLRERLKTTVPWILTLRSENEGGDWHGNEAEQVERLASLAPVAEFVDVELATRRVSEKSHHWPHDLIFSKHDVAGRPKSLLSDLFEMLDAEDCKTPKLAWRARSVRDNFEAFELMRTCTSAHTTTGPKPGIIICMGPEGLASRVLAKKFGAFATFAAIAPDRASAPGQITIAELRDLYRWDAIDDQTRVFGVIGDPVDHSVSPHVHNAAFEETGHNAVYLPLKVAASYESFKAFMVEVSARPWLDFSGFSVTIPHKENALRWIREVEGIISDTAARVGAVNTMILKPDGSFEGHNTDCPAALKTITSAMGCSTADLAKMDVAVLGAGGVARAVVGGLTDLGARVTIFNRTELKATKLAETFQCAYAPWEERGDISAHLIVNCTSLGLQPDIEDSPLHDHPLRPNQTVFDTIYNPLQTKLLRQSAEAGCTVIDGVAMFALQARDQFNLWTGQALPTEFFRAQAEKFVKTSQ